MSDRPPLRQLDFSPIAAIGGVVFVAGVVAYFVIISNSMIDCSVAVGALKTPLSPH